MPQLEFATFASQIFWLAVTFGILYLVMAKSALPVVREVLQNRQTRITEDLKKAEKLKEEAESAEADFTSVLVTAKGKAGVLLGNVREKASVEADKRHAKLDETFSRQAKESEHRIDVIKKEAVAEMSPVDLARDIVKILIGVSLDKNKIEKAVLVSGEDQ
jgi:F-type H+-transporting ATPase subunit b